MTPEFVKLSASSTKLDAEVILTMILSHASIDSSAVQGNFLFAAMLNKFQVEILQNYRVGVGLPSNSLKCTPATRQISTMIDVR